MEGKTALRRKFARAARALAARLDALHMGTKLRLFFLFVCALPCLAAGSFTVVSAGDLLFAQRAQAVQRKHAQTRVVFSNAATLCVNVSHSVLFDEELRELLLLPEDQAARALVSFRGLDELMRSYPAIASIDIYTENRGLMGRSRFLDADADVRASAWFRAAAGSKGVIRWYVLEREEGRRQLCLVRKIPLGGERFAVMVIALSSDYLRLQTADGELLTGLYLDGEPFYGKGENLGEEAPYARLAAYRGSEMLACQSRVHILQSENAFTVVTADPDAPADLRNMRFSFAGLLCLPMLAALLIVWAYSRRLGRRVTVLRNQMRVIAEGGTVISKTVPGGDELGQLFLDMTRTIRVLQDLSRKVYEKELRYQKLLSYQKEIEYKMLASQINPHFLFNTLESIRMKAVMNKDREVACVVHKLGQIMRRLLSASQSTVTLRSELDLVRDYLEIQQFRHGERIAFEIEVAPQVDPDALYTLPLLLLPLVENAVLHGLDDKRGTGRIRVAARREEKALYLLVEDNGVGMEEERRKELLRRVKSGEPQPDGKHIGLYNVAQRIRLSFGGDFGLCLHSRKDEGTRVELRLPIRTERDR